MIYILTLLLSIRNSNTHDEIKDIHELIIKNTILINSDICFHKYDIFIINIDDEHFTFCYKDIETTYFRKYSYSKNIDAMYSVFHNISNKLKDFLEKFKIIPTENIRSALIFPKYRHLGYPHFLRYTNLRYITESKNVAGKFLETLNHNLKRNDINIQIKDIYNRKSEVLFTAAYLKDKNFNVALNIRNNIEMTFMENKQIKYVDFSNNFEKKICSHNEFICKSFQNCQNFGVTIMKKISLRFTDATKNYIKNNNVEAGNSIEKSFLLLAIYIVTHFKSKKYTIAVDSYIFKELKYKKVFKSKFKEVYRSLFGTECQEVTVLNIDDYEKDGGVFLANNQ